MNNPAENADGLTNRFAAKASISGSQSVRSIISNSLGRLQNTAYRFQIGRQIITAAHMAVRWIDTVLPCVAMPFVPIVLFAVLLFCVIR
ncbi:hypothetical protein CGZ60_06560 [Neisseria animalis]|nr:hypothetical protein CGZ60_06560 [Neisseria animalis]